MKDFVLDSWALLCWLHNEPAAGAVEELWQGAGSGICALHMCILNLGEVFYITVRRRGWPAAEHIDAYVRSRVHIHAVPNDLVLRAASLKASHPISYADAFAAVTALEMDAPLVTGDPEIRAMARTVPQLQLHWLEN